jgi:hypothetical protein
MSYGTYSEVYFANHFTTRNLIKIGETTNARRRANQLRKEDYHIVISADVNGEEAARLFVESYLRTRIEATGKANRFRKDYFECENEDVAHWLFTQFQEWVSEANHILELIACGGTSSINFGSARRPIPPRGKEQLFKIIFAELESCGKYETHFQCKYKEQDEHFQMLNNAFAPFGYLCTTSRNNSWAYFTIEKFSR